ncbi:MAG TPA: hypothetical protein DCG12_17015 [Planctomycetaceae bacterium]|nr:hypothetical protein [Planctomycetaceae bacterium]
MAKQETQKATRTSQGGFMIWHGMTCSGLWRFMRSRPLLHWSRLHRILSLPFSAVYNSAMKLVEGMLYGRKVRETKIEHPPVFVIGYWRSGTTFLQNLLSRDPQFQHLGLYRALFPWHFLLTEKLVTRLTAKLLPTNRPMDNINVHWDSPQEDDLPLCIMSLLSPIHLLVRPHDQGTFWRTLDFDKLPAEEVSRWKNSLSLLMKKLTFASGKRIMMKSPYHLFHVPTLLEMYPDARILYIHRNPYNVFRSTMHLRRRMIEENTLGRLIMDGSEEAVIGSYRLGFEHYEKTKHMIPEGHHHAICYEDLEKDPIGVLRGAYEGLSLPGFENLEQALLPEVESLKRYKKNVFDDDPYWVNKVYEDLKDIFEQYGYERPEVAGGDATDSDGATAAEDAAVVETPAESKKESPSEPNAASA